MGLSDRFALGDFDSTSPTKFKLPLKHVCIKQTKSQIHKGRQVAWVIADAAGKRRQPCTAGHVRPQQCARASYQCCPTLPLSEQGGGGAWIVHLAGGESRVAAGGLTAHLVQWRYRAWTAAELDESSTWLESVNATKSIDAAVAGGAQDVVVVLDSASWVAASRRLSCHATSLVAPTEHFGAWLGGHLGVRVWLLHHHRERGPEADGVSKAFLAHESGGTCLEWASAQLVLRGFEPLSPSNRV